MLAQQVALLSSEIELKLVDIAQDESNTEKEQARHRAKQEEEREELAKERKENERQRERDKARMEKFRKREAELDKREKEEIVQAELRTAVFNRTLRNGTHQAASRASPGGDPKHVSFRPILRSRTYTAGCCGLADTEEVLSCPSKLEQQKGLEPRDTSSVGDTTGQDLPQDELEALGVEMLPGILSLPPACSLTLPLSFSLSTLLLVPSLFTRPERASWQISNNKSIFAGSVSISLFADAKTRAG